MSVQQQYKASNKSCIVPIPQGKTHSNAYDFALGFFKKTLFEHLLKARLEAGRVIANKIVSSLPYLTLLVEGSDQNIDSHNARCYECQLGKIYIVMVA